MKILAIDLGRSKSVACDYVGATGDHEFETIQTTPEGMHDLIVKRAPEVVVIEICPSAGWIKDMCEALGVKIVVADTSGDAWKWKKMKKKSDRADSLKLAKLQTMNQIDPVHVPKIEVRQWRLLIGYRESLISERTSMRNRIRGVMDAVALKLPAGVKAFSGVGQKDWKMKLTRELKDCPMDQLWRGIILEELKRLDELDNHLAMVDAKLNELAKADERVRRVSQVPAVGTRTAEIVVALLDEPGRFRRGKQVGSYCGLTPRKYQSGDTDRDGRISRKGNRYVRALLVQASWGGVSRWKVPWMIATYERVKRGSDKRKKKAIVAVARRLMVRLWAMLRDGTAWRDLPACSAAM